MKKTHEELKKEFKEHLENRPQLPRPVPPYDSQEYRNYSLALQTHQEEASRLEVEIAMADPTYPLTRSGRLKKKKGFGDTK